MQTPSRCVERFFRKKDTLNSFNFKGAKSHNAEDANLQAFTHFFWDLIVEWLEQALGELDEEEDSDLYDEIASLVEPEREDANEEMQKIIKLDLDQKFSWRGRNDWISFGPKKRNFNFKKFKAKPVLARHNTY